MAQDKNQKTLNVPPLRFPGFTDDWKKTTLGEITTNFNLRNKEQIDYPMFSVTNNRGFIPQSEQFEDREMKGEDIKAYKVIHHNDFAYNPARINVGSIAKYNGYEPCMISSLYVCFKANNEVNEDWLMHLLRTPKVQYYYQLNGEGGVRIYLFYPNFARIRTSIPSIEEQKKIAKILSIIDERIATQNKIIEDLKKLKSAIIDYTFGNKKYLHRKRVLLSDVSVKITRRNSDNQIFNVLSNSANYGIIPQSEVFDHEIANENNTSNYFVISKNDFVYNPRKSVTAPYGPINRYNGETAGVISPLYLCFRCYGLDVEYLGWYFKSDSWYKYVYQNGDTGVRHDRVSIKDDIFFSMPLFIHNADEQIEIAKRLNKIESFVKQEKQYLFLLESQKLYLLQRMFI